MFAPWVNATDQYLLAVCFGGVILGAGVGLVIRFGGCLDGTETVAIAEPQIQVPGGTDGADF